jgi:membrane fusion protein (multidrug efflux system)
MFKKFLIALGGFIAVVLILGAVKAAQIKKMASAPHMQPVSAVTTYAAQEVVWHPSLQAIGTLAPVQGVTISADADGTIVKIAAESGTTVKAGDLLVQLDTSVETAQLNATQARGELARVNIERARGLLESQSMSKSEYDTIEASYKQSQADVAALQALIDKKHVRAPFDGRIGIRLVNEGQYVSKGRALMPLQKLNPIFVNFSVPQRHLPDLVLGQQISVTVDAFAGTTFPGVISAINSEVDAASRNVSVQATLENPAEVLRSGMFAQVEIELPVAAPKIVLPATAIAYASYGNSVFIVENMKGKDGVEYLGVRQQIVQLGATRGDLIAIEDGVKPGEQVVSAGVFKLRNGAHIQVNNIVQPSANPTPKPANT